MQESQTDKNSVVFKWIIDDFLHKEDQKLVSSPFTAPGHDDIAWCLRCFPDGDVKDNVGFVSVFLCKEDKTCDATIQYELSMVAPDGQLIKPIGSVHCFTRNEYGWGNSRMIRRQFLIDDPEKYLPDGQLIVHIRLTILGVVYEDERKTRKANLTMLSRDFNKHFADRRFCDVQLNVDGQSFGAHKFILAARSSVFDKMFANEFVEIKSCEIGVKEFDASVIKQLLKYFYTAEVDDLDSISERLIVAAEYYQVIGLKMMCEKNLIARLTIDNCIEYLKIADRTKAVMLKKAAIDFINFNKKMLQQSASFSPLSKTHPNLVLELYEAVDHSLNKQQASVPNIAFKKRSDSQVTTKGVVKDQPVNGTTRV